MTLKQPPSPGPFFFHIFKTLAAKSELRNMSYNIFINVYMSSLELYDLYKIQVFMCLNFFIYVSFFTSPVIKKRLWILKVTVGMIHCEDK